MSVCNFPILAFPHVCFLLPMAMPFPPPPPPPTHCMPLACLNHYTLSASPYCENSQALSYPIWLAAPGRRTSPKPFSSLASPLNPCFVYRLSDGATVGPLHIDKLSQGISSMFITILIFMHLSKLSEMCRITTSWNSSSLRSVCMHMAS